MPLMLPSALSLTISSYLCNLLLHFCQGTTNVWASSFQEHAVTNMYTHPVIVLFKKQHSSTIGKNTTITKVLIVSVTWIINNINSCKSVFGSYI